MLETRCAYRWMSPRSTTGVPAKLKTLACLLIFLVTACADDSSAEPASVFVSAAAKAVEDSGFASSEAVYVREALYADVLALQAEGDPEELSATDRDGLEEAFEPASVVFFSDPSDVVDGEWNLLPERLVVLIGPIEEEDNQTVVRVGVMEGSEPEDLYVGWYSVDPESGEVGESPRITVVP